MIYKNICLALYFRELIRGERDFRKKMKARTRKLLKSTKPDATMLKLMEIEDL